MEFVDNLENVIKEEMKKFIGDVEELKWEEIFFDRGNIDFHDHELEIEFWNGSYGESYYFFHDYERNVGSFCKNNGTNNPDEIKSWGEEE